MEDSYVETKVEALQDNRSKVTVTIEAKDIDARIKKTYKNFAVKYNFPGFRSGKAPRPVIDNALGAEAITATVTDEVVNETYPLAIDGNGLHPIAKPDFDENMGLVEGGKPFTFSFEVNTKPEFELTSYEPMEIEMPAEGATDEEIEEQIESLREHYYAFEDAAAATKVKEGSYLDMSIKATDDKGEDIETLTTESRLYGLGAGMFPEAFDQELLGMKKGQSKTFEIAVPEDSTDMLAALAGTTEKVTFEITVIVLKNKTLPELTDEWTKDTLGFESVEELRTRIAESIAQQKSEILPRLKESLCMGQLADRLEGDMPESMCEEAETSLLQDFFGQLQRQGMTFDSYLMQQNITPDQFKEDVKQQALDMVKQDLALDAWAKHFELFASDDDITAEFVNSGAENPQALQEDWRKNGQLHMVRAGIQRTNAAQDVMEKAVVSELKPEKKADEKEKKAAKKPAAKKKAASDDAAADEKKPAKKAASKKTAEKKEAAAE